MIEPLLALKTINDRIIWSQYVKWILIIAIAVILAVVVVLLIIELIGKKNHRAVIVTNKAEDKEEIEEEITEVAEEPKEETQIVPLVLPEREFEVLQSVDAADVSELMNNEVAAANIENDVEEVFGVEYSDKKSKAVINVDALSELFSAGETVTLEEMKNKNLVSKRTTFVKVLARGKIDKPLIVVADAYSIEAAKMILLTGGRVIQKKQK